MRRRTLNSTPTSVSISDASGSTAADGSGSAEDHRGNGRELHRYARSRTAVGPARRSGRRRRSLRATWSTNPSTTEPTRPRGSRRRRPYRVRMPGGRSAIEQPLCPFLGPPRGLDELGRRRLLVSPNRAVRASLWLAVVRWRRGRRNAWAARREGERRKDPRPSRRRRGVDRHLGGRSRVRRTGRRSRRSARTVRRRRSAPSSPRPCMHSGTGARRSSG